MERLEMPQASAGRTHNWKRLGQGDAFASFGRLSLDNLPNGDLPSGRPMARPYPYLEQTMI